MIVWKTENPLTFFLNLLLHELVEHFGKRQITAGAILKAVTIDVTLSSYN